MKNSLRTVKIAGLVLALLFASVAGCKFWEERHFKEPVVIGPGVTEVKKLSDYSPVIKGTVNDCNIYIMDSGKPGGTALLIGGTHPEEPVGNLTASIFVENIRVTSGKVLVAIRANTSASLSTRMGEGYPRFLHIKTPWGVKKWRMGDRCAKPLDSWPDPEVYVHYPSGQTLAYMDIRNFNRTWPGKKDGLLVQRTNYAFMEMIRKEKVDIEADLHGAELEYPVENTIVAHEKAEAVAAMTSMILTSSVFPVPIGMEYSPKALHGLSHREIGDYSDAMSLLMEAAEPMLDRIRGITDERLLLDGKDRFVIKAGEKKLLYAPIDENGWPMKVRVARHMTTFAEELQLFSQMNPSKAISLAGVPSYKTMVDSGLGVYFHDPSEVPAEKVRYD